MLFLVLEMVELDLSEVTRELILELGKVGLWVQAIGLLIILWLIFQVIALIVNRKKRKALYSIKGDLERIEKKIDKILKSL